MKDFYLHLCENTEKNKQRKIRIRHSGFILVSVLYSWTLDMPSLTQTGQHVYISSFFSLFFWGGGGSIAPIGSLVALNPVYLASPGPWSSSSVWNKLFQVSHSFYIYLYIFKGTLCNELLQSLTKAVTTRGLYFLLTCVLFTDMWNCDTSFLSYTNFLNRLGLLLC